MLNFQQESIQNYVCLYYVTLIYFQFYYILSGNRYNIFSFLLLPAPPTRRLFIRIQGQIYLIIVQKEFLTDVCPKQLIQLRLLLLSFYFILSLLTFFLKVSIYFRHYQLIFFQSIKKHRENINTMKYESMKQLIFLKGTQKKILDLLENKESIQFIDFVDENNNTPLHYAVSLNYKIAIRKYLQLLKNQELWEHKLGISNIKMEVVIFRTKNWINSQNSDGLTAMHYAALKGDLQIAEMLENAGARFDKVTKSGLNVYTMAAQEGKFQLLLFFRGKLDINAKDGRGCTALHWSCYKGHESIVRYLISQSNIQMDFRDNEGKTPLHLATIYKHSKIVQVLLQAGANRFIKDKSDKLAQDYAQQNNFQKIYKMLTKKQKVFCCSSNVNFQYMPKQKQNCKWIIILFLLFSVIISCNFVLNRTPIHFLTSHENVPLSDYDFVQGWIFLGVSLLMNAIGLTIGLHIHCKKNQNQFDQHSLQYIKNNINLLDNYCFECQWIQDKGTSHCNICHKCVDIKIKHSDMLGRCIDLDNRFRYLSFLFTVAIVLALSIVYGVSQLLFILTSQQQDRIWTILKITLAAIDFLCIIPFLYVLIMIIKTIRMLLRIKQYVISSKLSETTLDSRSTLVIEKLKAIKLDESIRQEKMTKKKQNKNSKRYAQEQRLSHEQIFLEN